jgi:2-oxo-4-hydroxy-4-carboxy-5-ureidoimidazoline decarboxylase
MPTLETLNAASEVDFVSLLGGVFEASPWVAAGAAPGRPYASPEALHAAMVRVVKGAGEEAQLALLRAHPDLAGRAALAGNLSEASRAEQGGAGLDRLSETEYRRFHALNTRYRERFGFPFILAVKGHTKESILAAFEERLPNSPEQERARALHEVFRIAHFRLRDLFNTP